MSSGLIFVLSAPSGAGKGTVLKQVMERVPGLALSISHTTRASRSGEADGVHYHFTDRDEFRTMIARGDFLEWAEVHGNMYGTSRWALETLLAQGLDVVLEIDVQGAGQVLRKMPAPPVTVFLIPPSLAEMERRLRARATENEGALSLRLANAEQEMRVVADYEYLVVNDRVEDAARQLAAIIYAERAKHRRLLSGAPAPLWSGR
ncbi:MAG: guanylate kinase [Desulfobulbaceae bacterium]|nr:guanylate kinase [Desulfobulbaceae bacterium]